MIGMFHLTSSGYNGALSLPIFIPCFVQELDSSQSKELQAALKNFLGKGETLKLETKVQIKLGFHVSHLHSYLREGRVGPSPETWIDPHFVMPVALCNTVTLVTHSNKIVVALCNTNIIQININHNVNNRRMLSFQKRNYCTELVWQSCLTSGQRQQQSAISLLSAALVSGWHRPHWWNGSRRGWQAHWHVHGNQDQEHHQQSAWRSITGKKNIILLFLYCCLITIILKGV